MKVKKKQKQIKIYKYRDCLIMPTENGWYIDKYCIDKPTLKEAYNYIDSKLGGWSGKHMPNRWTEDMVRKFYS